jgi:hypothetical protein
MESQLALTPASNVFGFRLLPSIPFRFGHEANGYRVSNIDAALAAAR